jgi:hypothetical protein
MKTYRMMIALLVSMFLMTSTAWADEGGVPNENGNPDHQFNKFIDDCGTLAGVISYSAGHYTGDFNPGLINELLRDFCGNSGKVNHIDAGAVD